MKKKIMYALMFTLICICAIVIGKIKFSGTEKQQPSSLVSETDNLRIANQILLKKKRKEVRKRQQKSRK